MGPLVLIPVLCAAWWLTLGCIPHTWLGLGLLTVILTLAHQLQFYCTAPPSGWLTNCKSMVTAPQSGQHKGLGLAPSGGSPAVNKNVRSLCSPLWSACSSIQGHVSASCDRGWGEHLLSPTLVFDCMLQWIIGSLPFRMLVWTSSGRRTLDKQHCRLPAFILFLTHISSKRERNKKLSQYFMELMHLG